MEARRLGPGGEDELRAVRLAALGTDPQAFGSTLAREESFGPDDWTRRLTPPSATFVVGTPAVGMAWGVPDADDPGLAHLYGMWVAAEARGRGAAGALIGAVAAWAAGLDARRLHLTVVVGNEPAERLYLRHGFVVVGHPRLGPDHQMERDMELALS